VRSKNDSYATFIFVHYFRQWNEVNIGGDYVIGRSVCPSVCLCVCVHDA